MGDMRRCARCGSFYTTDTEVCQDCKKKDFVDLKKLRGFIEDGSYVANMTKQDVLNSTGIRAKDLNRYLSYEEFEGIYFAEANGISNNIIKGAELNSKGTINA